MIKKRLYHGSTHLFSKIDVNRGKGYKDFGQGFYTTENILHAENIARRNGKMEKERLRRYQDGKEEIPLYIYEYDFDMDLISDFSTKIFSEIADLEWIDFIIANRHCKTKAHDFDIVIGATADDDMRTSFVVYKKGLLGEVGSENAKSMLLELLKANVFSQQIYFGSQYAADSLTFVRRRLIL